MTSENQTFPNLAKKRFQFLLNSYGFQVRSEIYTGVNLSEWIIIWISDYFKLRIIQDKGQVFIDVGPSYGPDKWFDLNDVTAFLMRGSDKDEWSYQFPKGVIDYDFYDQQLVYLAEILRNYLHPMMQLFDKRYFDKRRETELKKYINKRASKRWGDIT